MVLCSAQSVTCRRWMDGHERREQRRHGGTGSGGQRDDANQPDWHEHRWLPHSLIAHHRFRAWGQKNKLCRGKERIRCALSANHTCYSVSGAGAPYYQRYWLITLSTAQICKCDGKLPQNTWTLSKQPLLIHLAFPGPFSVFGTLL